jgi:protein TonB
MLAYAANAPRHAERRSSPNAMLAVIAVHVAVIAAVMSAKMDLPQRIKHKPLVVEWIDLVKPPPPNEPVHNPVRPQSGPTSHQPVYNHPIANLVVPTGPTTFDPGPITGPTLTPTGDPVSVPTAAPLRAGPRLLTPASELKPPYPHEKLLSEEEALLKLRLSIDEGGRVTAVEPVGRADPVFLRAARQYLLAHWRYRPASEDGRAVASSIVVTMHFSLEG